MKEIGSLLLEEIGKGFLVDDFLSGADTEAEATLFIGQMKDLLKTGGFNLESGLRIT